MDSDVDAESTQQATQPALDPRRLGKQNSGFSDEDLADIICILIPNSQHTRHELARIAKDTDEHLIGGDDSLASDVEAGLAPLDGGKENGCSEGLIPHGEGQYALALRFSARVKDPLQGFTFGRNQTRCDVCFAHDPMRRLSNVHFRIYLNEYGVLMLEDLSTNGTVVNKQLLASRKGRESGEVTRMMLNNGDEIKVLLHKGRNDIKFIVRIPRREGEYEVAWREKLKAYLERLEVVGIGDANATIGPGPEGHVDLFPQARENLRTSPAQRRLHPAAAAQYGRGAAERTQVGTERLPKAWNGSDRYHRVAEIGKGAFATVYMVTDIYYGVPFAAKELDKRKFMKDNVHDAKVENEMRIMQRVKHPNIVEYKDHLTWDDRLLIIIMEYVPGGDLGRLILEGGPLNETAVQTMARQLLDALGYLNEHNITHRDVKPDNILISSESPFVVKLTDFGLSKMVDNEQTFLRTFCGTLLYCAPEVYSEFAEYDEFGRRNPRNRQRRQGHGQRYDHAVDIWSLGGVLFYAMTGAPPFPVKQSVSHSELLHRIMTEELDVNPLRQKGISAAGVDFVKRMLNRRPENRATVEMLKNHVWLGGRGDVPGASYDEISDDGLDHRASQLSLEDGQAQGQKQVGVDLMPVLEDEDEEEYGDENEFMGYESEKENYTCVAQTQRPQLFGEVNVSAIGSSGVIPVERLNLPISGTSFGTTEILGEYEVRDSFESEETPRQKGQQQRSQPYSDGLRLSALVASQSHSVDELNNMTFDVESQDLGGAESIMGNLNMRSVAQSHFPSSSVLLQDDGGGSYFTTSKRKTSYDNNSDGGSETSAMNHDRPIIKRFKSEALFDSMTDYSSDDDGEFDLLAHIPPVARARSSRQMDEPVNKSTYWTAGDRKSYHLRYPEMTQFQLDAFRSAANARGEEFGPGKTALWDLAMKYFPPAHYEQLVGRLPLDVETVSNASNDVRSGRLKAEDVADDSEMPSTAGAPAVAPAANDDDIPDTLVPQRHIIVPIQANPPGKRIVASLQSSPESGIQRISIHVTESMLSWGRGPENTRVYEHSKERKIPKYAFKILLWKAGYDPSKDFRPWNQKLDSDEEAFHFYISTKSSNGIFINGTHLRSHDCKNPSTPSRDWHRLHDGDKIVVWKDATGQEHGESELVFRCAWGGSARPRSDVATANLPPPSQVPELVARKLDEFCFKAERRVKANDERDFKIAEAEIDRNERAADVQRERERSKVFELRRLEACRVLAVRGSRRGSPASAPARLSPGPGQGQLPGIPVGGVPMGVAVGRTVPNLKRMSPGPGPGGLGLLQDG